MRQSIHGDDENETIEHKLPQRLMKTCLDGPLCCTLSRSIGTEVATAIDYLGRNFSCATSEKLFFPLLSRRWDDRFHHRFPILSDKLFTICLHERSCEVFSSFILVPEFSCHGLPTYLPPLRCTYSIYAYTPARTMAASAARWVRED